MRERREIAGCADGSLRGDARQDVVLEELHQALDDQGTHTRAAHGQHLRAQRDHRAHDGCGEIGTHTTGVAAQEIVLQRADLASADPSLGEGAKTRVHSIDVGCGVTRLGQTRDESVRSFHALARLHSEVEVGAAMRQRVKFVEAPGLAQWERCSLGHAGPSSGAGVASSVG